MEEAVLVFLARSVGILEEVAVVRREIGLSSRGRKGRTPD